MKPQNSPHLKKVSVLFLQSVQRFQVYQLFIYVFPLDIALIFKVMESNPVFIKGRCKHIQLPVVNALTESPTLHVEHSSMSMYVAWGQC